MPAFLARRSSNKQWLQVNDQNSGVCYRRFAEVGTTYANIIDYCRVPVAFFAIAAVPADLPLLAGALIVISYLMDWVDGPVARRMNQCTYLGASLDWFADVLTTLAQVYWWSVVHPASALLVGWPFLIAQLGYMLLDTICYSQARYPALYVKDKGAAKVSRVLSWSLRPGTHGSLYMYTNFYSLIWITFPIVSSALCTQLQWGYTMFAPESSLLADCFLALMWGPGVVLSLIFCFTDSSLGWLLLINWSEPRNADKSFSVRYTDLEHSAFGGCTVLRPKAEPEVDASAFVSSLLPKICNYATAPAALAAEVAAAADLHRLVEKAGSGEAVGASVWLPLTKTLLLVPLQNTAHAPLAHLLVHTDADTADEAAGVAVQPTSLARGDIVRFLPGTRVRLAGAPNGDKFLAVVVHHEQS